MRTDGLTRVYFFRYGREGGLFVFESGRRCATGSGVFAALTNDNNAIFVLIDGSVAIIMSVSHQSPVVVSGSVWCLFVDMFVQ